MIDHPHNRGFSSCLVTRSVAKRHPLTPASARQAGPGPLSSSWVRCMEPGSPGAGSYNYPATCPITWTSQLASFNPIYKVVGATIADMFNMNLVDQQLWKV